MNNSLMIEKLKSIGMAFDKGLSNEEFFQIESTLGFRFPSEIRSFLACGVPLGAGFNNWRDLSDANIQYFNSFYSFLDKTFRFDIENNLDDLRALLDPMFCEIEDLEQYTEAVLDYLHQSTKLIPFYGHRCFFDGMDGMPIISFWQPVDSIFYGKDFEDYLEREFLGKQQYLKPLNEQIKNTGIWYDLIQ